MKYRIGIGESWEEDTRDEFGFGHVGFSVPMELPRSSCPIGNWDCQSVVPREAQATDTGF